MTAVIKRYGIIFIIALFIVAALTLWLILGRDEISKIPARGVFV